MRNAWPAARGRGVAGVSGGANGESRRITAYISDRTGSARRTRVMAEQLGYWLTLNRPRGPLSIPFSPPFYNLGPLIPP